MPKRLMIIIGGACQAVPPVCGLQRMRLFVLLAGGAAVCFLCGCAAQSRLFVLTGMERSFPAETIVRTEDGTAVSFEIMIDDLQTAGVLYIGEQHVNPYHHRAQRQIMEALARTRRVIVGMEMFAAPYQHVLDEWSQGALDRQSFIEKTHWYANWKYDFDLYAGILETISEHHIPLVGLNVPFDIPAKVAVGGLSNLLDADRVHLPDVIDVSQQLHRAYVKKVFERHHMRGRDNFEYFYQAQCVWEEAMAERVASCLNGDEIIIVLAGNGHIIKGFGIPDRVRRRRAVSSRTVYLTTPGQEAERDYADYIWITQKAH